MPMRLFLAAGRRNECKRVRDPSATYAGGDVRRRGARAAGVVHVSDVLGKTALDERVMAVMGSVPRHEFVPVELQPYAYANIPLPIGFEKTISQPFIVALMTDLLDISANDAVLEI